MELVSLIIMALGLAALGGIYVLSRVSRRQLPQKRDESVPVLRDADGNERTSVQHDVPARDGKRPTASARALSDALVSGMGKPATEGNVASANTAPALPPQLVLFVAAPTEEGFAGEAVLQALHNADLSFGEMDIFHRRVLSEQGEVNLFSVANGVKPWTLNPDELLLQNTPGLSLILNLPSPVDNTEAIHDFVRTAECLAAELDGILTDQYQQPLTPEVRATMLALAA